MSTSVRMAHLDDVEWIALQLQAFSSFYGTKRPLYNESLIRGQLEDFIQNHLMLVAECEGERVGFVGGYLIPHSMNPEIRTLVETFFWVAPDKRGGRAALLLLDEYDRVGAEKADWVTFTLEHHSPMSERHLLRRGFRLQERNYLKEIA